MNTLEIWNDFSRDLLKFIQRRVSSRYDAEDILQNVFRKIHDSIHDVGDENKIQSWVYRIARNAVTDFYRSSAKKNASETQLAEDGDFPQHQDEESNLNTVVSRWLRCMVQRLDDKYREAIALTEFGHLTQKELAGRLGISLSGAKSRVQRGREKLREMLLDCCHIERDRLGNVIDYERNTASCACSGC